MSLPGASVRRPIFTTMVTLIVVLVGLVSLSRLRVDLFPAIELPTLTVRAEYEGASPEVMERLVTQILEEILATVQGVEEMTSVTSEGRTNVRLAFSWGTDLDTAAQDVRAMLEAEANELPDEVTRPTIRKFDIASFPVVILGISSDLDPVELTELVDRQIRQRFARLPGVAQVDMWGEHTSARSASRSTRARLRALRLLLDRVLAAIRDANLDLPAGQIDEGRFEVTLRAPAEFTDLDQCRATVVAMRDDAPVTLAQVATVVDTWRKQTRVVRVDGQRGLRIAIRKQADANTVEVSAAVLAEAEGIAADYPQIRIVPVSNQGNFIERSIQNVARSVLYGGGLAVLVLLFFLRSLRSTVVISTAIPISIVATFALIYFGGFTLNLMTLGGLALGVGMMVDSSIVVLENVFRRREEVGEDGTVAAVEGAREVAPAIVASTLTTLVIFLPMVFMRGVTGFLFQELAWVIAFSLACSLVVATSLVPMLSARLLRARGGAPGAPAPAAGRGVAGLAEHAFRGIEDGYRDLLGAVLRHRTLTVVGCLALLGASLLLAPLVGTEFMPPSDEGEVRVTGEMEVGTRLGLVDEQTRVMEAIVMPTVPEVVASVVTVGAMGFRTDATTQGEIALSLTPAAARARSNGEVADDLRRLLAGRVPGMELRVRAPQGQFLMNRILGEEEGLVVEIRGDDLATL
ncbi:MAG: efflux RND transporter permease subunit, partial [Planctomycetota bacterium]